MEGGGNKTNQNVNGVEESGETMNEKEIKKSMLMSLEF